MHASEKFPAASRAEILAALFAQLVIQQTNLALMLLGRIANPQTGEMMHDPETAGFFIDQLDMLEAKTRGNLGPEEEQLLKQSLVSLRLAFVETVNAPAGDAGTAKQTLPPESPAVATSAGRKFSKKY